MFVLVSPNCLSDLLIIETCSLAACQESYWTLCTGVLKGTVPTKGIVLDNFFLIAWKYLRICNLWGKRIYFDYRFIGTSIQLDGLLGGPPMCKPLTGPRGKQNHRFPPPKWIIMRGKGTHHEIRNKYGVGCRSHSHNWLQWDLGRFLRTPLIPPKDIALNDLSACQFPENWWSFSALIAQNSK